MKEINEKYIDDTMRHPDFRQIKPLERIFDAAWIPLEHHFVIQFAIHVRVQL